MKRFKDLKKGDVIRTEFDAFDNFMTVRLVEDFKRDELKVIEDNTIFIIDVADEEEEVLVKEGIHAC
jgi:hypothetical protein